MDAMKLFIILCLLFVAVQSIKGMSIEKQLKAKQFT